MSTDHRDIGERITSLRERAGLSGNALAKQCGISQPYLWQIESGEREPTVSTLRKIADALGVSLKKIIPE